MSNRGHRPHGPSTLAGRLVWAVRPTCVGASHSFYGQMSGGATYLTAGTLGCRAYGVRSRKRWQ